MIVMQDECYNEFKIKRPLNLQLIFIHFNKRKSRQQTSQQDLTLADAMLTTSRIYFQLSYVDQEATAQPLAQPQ